MWWLRDRIHCLPSAGTLFGLGISLNNFADGVRHNTDLAIRCVIFVIDICIVKHKSVTGVVVK